MINKLYSILVSGCDDIPENFEMYRKYSKINVAIPELPVYSDPFRRSLWANSIISIAQTSDLYDIIRILDPANSYDTKPKMIPYVYDSSNTNVLTWSDSHPILIVSGEAQNGIAMYSYNNVGPVMADLSIQSTLDVLGYTISSPEGDGTFSLHVSNPAVSIDIPSVSDVLSNSKYISDVISNVDINDEWDRVALFCIYILRRYDGKHS